MQRNNSTELLRLAIPSDGEMYDSTLGFLRECGVPVDRTNSRRYTGSLHSLESVMVLFQRAADITAKVEDGSADIGIVGLDRFAESHLDDGPGFVICDDLGYSQCELVTAVPEAWVDVTDMADVADLAVEFRERGRDLRVATKYPRLTQRFFFSHGINFFAVVPSSGTLEAAPIMGFADLIVDISATGTTLRENKLKVLADGTVLRSQACLIGNRTTLKRSAAKQELARRLIERMEAYLEARRFFRIAANVRGPSADHVARAVLERLELAGLKGPTVSQVYTPEGDDWYAVTVVVPQSSLQAAVDHLRAIGGTGVSVLQPRYVFHEASQVYRKMLKTLSQD
ncbi:MAG: ATP phosphoribosyltransferase [Dehalococcoidia bacterium]|nr:ATP phosphoribosyltransferase [Dehalococcoidia bacterium]